MDQIHNKSVWDFEGFKDNVVYYFVYIYFYFFCDLWGFGRVERDVELLHF